MLATGRSSRQGQRTLVGLVGYPRRVADAMVTIPVTHDAGVTVGELRELFLDDHVHMALLVDGPALVAAVERRDLESTAENNTPARYVGSLDGRTVRPDTPLAEVFETMRARRRRLAVTNERGELLGLLCLKASGLGFCSDADVESRKRAARSTAAWAQPRSTSRAESSTNGSIVTSGHAYAGTGAPTFSPWSKMFLGSILDFSSASRS